MSWLTRRSLLLTAGLAPLALNAPAWAAPAVSLQPALDDIRAMVASASGETGLVVAVTDRDGLLMVATHGYADIARRQAVTAETRFAIGSISKSFTALTLLQIADEGRFDPTAPVAHYLPEFHPRSRFAPITSQALVTHTAGLPDYLANLASMRFLIAALNDFEPSYAPGAHFWYSNAGYQLLGYVAERIEGRPFPLILQQRMLDPLGMASSAPQIDDRLRSVMAASYTRTPDGVIVEAPWFDYLAADGGIVSTAPEMARFARMLLARGALPGGRLVSARAFDRFATPALEGYGYGIEVSKGGDVLSHTGSIAGFRADIEVHVVGGFAVVMLANGPREPGLRDRIVARLTQAMGGVPKAVAPAKVLLSDPASFAGRYFGRDGAALEFAAGPAGLVLKQTGAALPLSRLGRDSWGLYLTPAGPRSFRFFRDASGTVTDVSVGTESYAPQGSDYKPVALPAAWHPFVGRYMAHGEEGPGVRILARGGRLLMAYSDSDAPPTPLAEFAPGRFRFADPDYAPERLAFDTEIDGSAQRLVLSGVPLYRIDLP